MSNASQHPTGDTGGGSQPRFTVGVDLVAVDEVRSAAELFGDRYLTRVFTDHELARAKGEGEVRARQLAALFAAKEATMKVLGPTDRLPAWRSIDVRQDKSGRYTLRLSGYAAELAKRARLSDFAVSLSHEGSLATAVVFALTGER
jgi:holo-[acyl-carrier protein] synthase